MRYLLLIALLAAGKAAAADPAFERPAGPAMEVLALLQKVTPTSSRDELQQTAAKGAAILTPQSPAAVTLTEVATSDQSVDELQAKLGQVRDDLAFEPLREAELPANFPTYTPPGVIELKIYPKNRRAVAKEFFPLFAHITRNKIAMTAPVRMEFDRNDAGELQQESMAFYYGDADSGELGPDDNDSDVNTIADDGQSVVALGQRGRWNRKKVAHGEQLLRQWLKANPKYEAVEGVVLMGYNSPMTPTARQFFEIQLPVIEASAEKRQPGGN
ncbi:hypothetical protein PLANPX_2984 [Lacipirellula parvula]|uniref:SOUL heme-binding protein n=2 Tax=Lacipirellula parvula TaxID=2650471 RepID=A0A5K7XBP6_9BACT|nr:hypothetical protein PLANPX_2984 [Lacipirellula parvula]